MGGRYPGTSFIHVRMVGSILNMATFISASPSPQTGFAELTSVVVDLPTGPTGRSASTICRLFTGSPRSRRALSILSLPHNVRFVRESLTRGVEVARPRSLRSELYRDARLLGNVQAAAKGPGAYAERS